MRPFGDSLVCALRTVFGYDFAWILSSYEALKNPGLIAEGVKTHELRKKLNIPPRHAKQ